MPVMYKEYTPPKKEPVPTTKTSTTSKIQLTGGYVPPKPQPIPQQVPTTQPSTPSPTSRLGEVTPEIKKQEAERVAKAESKTEQIQQIQKQYPGYEVVKIEQVTVEVPSTMRGLPKLKEVTQVTLKAETPDPRYFASKASLFGVQEYTKVEGTLVSVTPAFLKLPKEKQSAIIERNLPSIKAQIEREKIVGISSGEAKYLTGFTLATTVATGTAIPVAGAFGIGAVGVAETIKVGTTGKHLTPEEAIGAGAIGVTIGVGAIQATRMAKPKVESMVTESYMKEMQRAFTLTTEQEIPTIPHWQPTLKEQALMKITGATPQKLATGIVDIPLPMQRVGSNLLVTWEVEPAIFEMGVAPQSAALTVSKIPSSILTGKGLPAYFGGLAMVPKVEIFQLPREEPKKIETPSTREMTIDGDKITVWTKQPPKALYEAPKGEPLSFKKLTAKTQISTVKETPSSLTKIGMDVGDVARSGASTLPLTEQQLIKNVESRISLDIGARAEPIQSMQTTTRIAQPTITVPPALQITSQKPKNIFTQYQGKPFYQTVTRAKEEEEQQVISYPLSVLKQPQTPTQPQSPLLRNVTNIMEATRESVSQTPKPLQIPRATSALVQTPLQTPIYNIPEPTIPKTPEPQFPLLTTPATPKLPSFFEPSGFKFEDFGFDRYPFPRFGLYTSRKKRYPILSPEKFLGM